jgi:hypothetical protein
MQKILIFLVIALLSACGTGGGEVPVVERPRTGVVVHLYGDSVTDGAAPYLSNYLAAGSTVYNYASWGQRAGGAINDGLPVNRDANHYYTFSWGVNECLNGEGTVYFQNSLEHIIQYMKGYRTVIEAPWHVLYGGIYNCTANIDNYRLVVQNLYHKYKDASGYNIAMPEIESRTDNIGDGIHLGEEHSRFRMQLLADAIYKLK